MSEETLYVPSIARDGRLSGRTAIVTGAGSAGQMGGTGSDIAILLAAKGANVVALDIDAGRVAHTIEAIERIDGNARPFVADITDAAACAEAAAFAQSTFGGADILVNNAAIAPGEQENLASMWAAIIELNLTAAKTMSDVVLPLMEQAGGGSIIHISSIAGFRAGGGIGYSAAKGGMIAMAKAQAFEYGPWARGDPDGPRFRRLGGCQRGPQQAHTPAPGQGDDARHRGNRMGRRQRRAVPRQ
jgi:NAD(P)-dependent dehydrogenase (short-subunit alcohol dehydrogenase family)